MIDKNHLLISRFSTGNNPVHIPHSSSSKQIPSALSGFLRAGTSSEKRVSMLCEAASELTESDIVALYRFPKKYHQATWLTFQEKRGLHTLPHRIRTKDLYSNILLEIRKAAVHLSSGGPFPKLLISPQMHSAMGIYVEVAPGLHTILVLNSRYPYYFSGTLIDSIEQTTTLINSERGGTDD